MSFCHYRYWYHKSHISGNPLIPQQHPLLQYSVYGLDGSVMNIPLKFVHVMHLLEFKRYR